jgi:hypothetical protein
VSLKERGLSRWVSLTGPVRKIILRTAEEKADQELSWSRPDEEFFASGACHVLAAAFLETHPHAGFEAWSLSPKTGHRGGHIVVVRDDLVFDWTGYGRRDAFLADYFEAMRRLFPDWDATLERVHEHPLDREFCVRTGARHPTQFLHDPLPRALAFVSRHPPPRAG